MVVTSSVAVWRCGRGLVMVWGVAPARRLRHICHIMMPLRRHFERVSAPVNFIQSINQSINQSMDMAWEGTIQVSSNKFYSSYYVAR